MANLHDNLKTNMAAIVNKAYWVFLSLVHANKYISVVQGLYTFQLLLCRTEIWFVHVLFIRAESYVVLFFQGNAVGSRENVLRS